MGEWFNPSVLKTEGSQGSVSSNLTASAKFMNQEFTDKILRFENVLNDKMFEKSRSFLSQPKWNLNVSDPNYQSHKVFWGMMLSDEKFFTQDVFKIVRKITKKNFEINKILANAQSALQDGSPHSDDIRPNAMTFILYANETWDYQWGGQTIFFDRYRIDNDGESEIIKNSDNVYSIYPIPNTAVLFPSNMIHYGMGPNRDFYGIRYTIAYHLLEI